MKNLHRLKRCITVVLLTVLFITVPLVPISAQNIGIGTNSPTQKFEVAGNLKIGDNLMVEGGDYYKVYRNLGTFSSSTNVTGAYVIWTTQSYDCMWSITVKGQEYVGLSFEYTIWGNGLTAFYNFRGTLKMPVYVGNYSGKLCIILSTVATVHYQPKITVTEFRQGRANIGEGWADGWEVNIWNDISWISNQTSVSEILNGVWNTSGSDIYYNLGKAGIGTTSPSYPLHVNFSNTTTGYRGIYSINNATTTGAQLYGIYGEVKSTETSDPGAGVYGYHNNTTGSSAGVKGVSNSGTGRGVFGYATDNFGLNFGVYGKTNSPSGYAGYFEGGVNYFQGDVGIGTYPSHRLHITNGNIKVENGSTFMYLNATNASTGQAGIQMQKNGTPRKSMYIANSNDYFYIFDNPTTHFDMSISPSGDVGIGTMNPGDRLHVYGGDALLENSEVYLRVKATSAGSFSGMSFFNHNGTYKRAIVYSNLWDKLYFYNAPNTRYDMAILDNGNIGIGTTDPASHLEVTGPDFQTLRLKSTTPNDIALEFLRYNAGGTDFVDWKLVNDNAIFRFLFSNDDLATAADGFMFYYVNPGGVNSWFGPIDNGNKGLGSSGNRWSAVYAVNGTIQTSDLREKENIADVPYGLDEVMKLHPVTYTWKKWPEQGTRIGLIAQEVQPVIGEVVKLEQTTLRDEHGKVVSSGEETYGMSYDQLIPVLIKAIQEQQAQIEVLEQKVSELSK